MLVSSFLCEDRRGILLWAKFRLQQERKEMLPEDVTEGEKKRQKKTETIGGRFISDRFLTFSPPYFFLLPINIDTRAHV